MAEYAARIVIASGVLSDGQPEIVIDIIKGTKGAMQSAAVIFGRAVRDVLALRYGPDWWATWATLETDYP